MIRRYSYYILSVFLVSVSFLYGRQLEETFKKRVPVENATRLSVDNSNGNITVNSWDSDEVEIIAYKKVNADSREDAERLMEELKVIIEQNSDEIRVVTEYPHHRHNGGGFWDWIMGHGGNGGYSVTYEIKVPRHFDLDVESTNGRIEIADCEGRLRLQTTNGKINAEDVKGSLRCKTTNGSIVARMQKMSGDDDMDFGSTNGSIKLYLPRGTNADISAHTTNGSIDCDHPMRRSHSESRRHLEGTINEGGPMIYLKTTNGSIRIYET